MSVLLNNVSFDGMAELLLKVMQIRCLALRAYSTITCGPPHKKFAHPCSDAWRCFCDGWNSMVC